MIQPRIGFSYDVNDDQRTVMFGGYGRYYDRNVFNNTLDEKFRLQYTIGRFEFSTDGLAPQRQTRQSSGTRCYLTREGLIALQATAITGLPELFAVKNNAKPPRTDQFSLGVRQRLGGDWQATATASYIRGKHGYTHLFGRRAECRDGRLLRRRVGQLVRLCQRPDHWLRQSRYALQGALSAARKALHQGIAAGASPSPTRCRKRSRTATTCSASISRRRRNTGSATSRGSRGTPWSPRAWSILPWGIQFSTLTKFGIGAAYQVFDANTPGAGGNYFDVNTTKSTGCSRRRIALGFLRGAKST